MEMITRRHYFRGEAINLTSGSDQNPPIGLLQSFGCRAPKSNF